MIPIYDLLLNTTGRFLLPILMSRAKSDALFSEGRLGRYHRRLSGSKRPRVWFHAASVGEVTGAIPIIHRLYERLEHCSILLTVATPQGFRFAQARLPRWVEVLPFPLDCAPILTRAFDQLDPDVYVALESEFWPNLYRFLRSRRVPAVLLNGRLSRRSARVYGLFKPLFQPIFEQFRWLAMHSQEDLHNALSLGASPERSLVLGSSKYEGMLDRVEPANTGKWRTALQIPAETPVVVGGSLRRSECVELLEVFARLEQINSELVAIFAPRHLEQLPNMITWLKTKGLDFQLLTNLENGSVPRRASIILVDRIGVLFELYALGQLVFCGGTLAPVGGHNILEPAAWKKPVFYGPHLQKVRYEHRILQKFGGSFLVRDKDDLFRSWSHWIEHPLELLIHGEKARLALEQLGEVASKQAQLIISALSQSANPKG